MSEKLNQNLLNILHMVTSEKELISGRKMNEAELAKLQYEYFDKKVPDPEIESIRVEISNRLKKLNSNVNSEFNKLLDAKQCAYALDQLYLNKETTVEQKSFIVKVKEYISKIKL